MGKIWAKKMAALMLMFMTLAADQQKLKRDQWCLHSNDHEAPVSDLQKGLRCHRLQSALASRTRSGQMTRPQSFADSSRLTGRLPAVLLFWQVASWLE